MNSTVEKFLGYTSYDILGHQTDITFNGTNLLEDSSLSKNISGQVRVFCSPGTCSQVWFSSVYRAYVYLWGSPAHSEFSDDNLLEWCLKTVVGRKYNSLRDLLGTFVIVVDEPEERRLTFITDILGVRPLFLFHQDGHVVFGSDVWSLQKAGVGSSLVNYDAVSAWIVYGYNCTDYSFFSDFQRLPAGSVSVFQDGNETRFPYALFESTSNIPPTVEVVDDLHQIVSSSVRTLVSKHSKISVALSGGYDSRYLLALAISGTETSVECHTVNFTNQEKSLSREVAKCLGVSLHEIPVPGAVWDLYERVFHFMADGFPISKFVTYCVAEQTPKIPMVNGFMGDSLLRGSNDTYLGKYEDEWNNDLADILQQKHMVTNCDGIRKEMIKRIIARSRVPMEHAVKNGTSLRKVFGWADFYYRQRFYISNNFLQHMHLSDALLPFYSWNLLAYKMAHGYKAFSPHVYDSIFRKYFPRLAKFPRTADLPTQQSVFGAARWTRQWAKELIPSLFLRGRLSLLEKKRSLPLMLGGVTGMRKAESSVLLFNRLYLLEEMSRQAGINFDWDSI